MKLKNYQEDMVLHVIDIMLEDHPEIEADETMISDVAAYVLNRIPAKYIMSERGFTRLAAMQLAEDNDENSLLDLVQIMMLVSKGMELVKHRRRHNGGEDRADDGLMATLQDVQSNIFLHNFPQFIGRVVEKGSGKPVINARITQYIDGVKAAPAEIGWLNPYYTNTATNGIYSFWPKAVKNSSDVIQSKIKITIEHDDYKPTAIEKVIHTKGSFRVYNFIQGDEIVNLETCPLVTKN
jgi:hypothetical protein